MTLVASGRTDMLEQPGPNKRGYMTFQPGPFDYGLLAADLADEARASAERINASKRKHIIEVGCELIKIKERLTHGHFIDWIDRELNFSAATARNYMAAAREFADKPLTVSVLPPATLYRLAGATPEVRQDIVSRVEAGEYVDREEVDEAIRRPKVEHAEAAKLKAEQAKKEARSARRRERREQNWKQKYEEEQEQERRSQLAAAKELIKLLSKHFTRAEIHDLNDLWRKTRWNSVAMVLADTPLSEVP